MKINDLLDSIGLIKTDYVEETASPIKVVYKGKRMVKLLLVAVIAILCMTLIVPTFATVVTRFDDYLYAMFPSIAQKLKPVQMSCVDNGIKLEVISAHVTDSQALIYISLEDLEGERVDETTDLFDSYRIRRPFDSSATCSMVNFDEDTGVATFLIQIDWYNARNILGSKVTFTLKEFLSNKQKFEGFLTNVDLTDVREAKETITDVSIRGGSYIDEEEILDEHSKYLKPDTEGLFKSPVNGARITGIGYIDGKLHVQTYYENIMDFDNHGWISLIDKNGIINHGEQSIAFWDEEEVGSYEEQVFDISPEELKEFRLHCKFVTADTITRGDWEVTFELN